MKFLLILLLIFNTSLLYSKPDSTIFKQCDWTVYLKAIITSTVIDSTKYSDKDFYNLDDTKNKRFLYKIKILNEVINSQIKPNIDKIAEFIWVLQKISIDHPNQAGDQIMPVAQFNDAVVLPTNVQGVVLPSNNTIPSNLTTY